MTRQGILQACFWFLCVSVVFMALVPGPLGQIVKSDTDRHFLAFLILPAFAFAGWPQIRWHTLWLAFAALGGAIEIVQWAMNMGRQAQWSDWKNDLVATTGSLAFCWLLRKMMEKPETNPPR